MTIKQENYKFEFFTNNPINTISPKYHLKFNRFIKSIVIPDEFSKIITENPELNTRTVLEKHITLEIKER